MDACTVKFGFMQHRGIATKVTATHVTVVFSGSSAPRRLVRVASEQEMGASRVGCVLMDEDRDAERMAAYIGECEQDAADEAREARSFEFAYQCALETAAAEDLHLELGRENDRGAL